MEKLYQLQCFQAAARMQNISEAARILHVSQPSLSQTIRRLEEDLGYPLFDRRGKRIYLNENGEIMLRAIERMSDIYQGAFREVEEQNGKKRREVSVYIGCASLHLPGLLEHLKKKTPQIKYHIFQWREQGMHENDIGIVALEGKARDYFGGESAGGSADKSAVESTGGIYRDHRYEVLFEEEIVLAVPAGHPLAKARRVCLSDLMDQELIGLNENWALGRIVSQNLQKQELRPETTVWVDNPSLMRDLLRKGLGIALVPSLSWEGFARNEVVMKRVEDFSVSRIVCICWRRDKYLTQQERDCIRGIREYFLPT